jgi:hypothetical protein
MKYNNKKLADLMIISTVIGVIVFIIINIIL